MLPSAGLPPSPKGPLLREGATEPERRVSLPRLLGAPSPNYGDKDEITRFIPSWLLNCSTHSKQNVILSALLILHLLFFKIGCLKFLFKQTGLELGSATCQHLSFAHSAPF